MTTTLTPTTAAAPPVETALPTVIDVPHRVRGGLITVPTLAEPTSTPGLYVAPRWGQDGDGWGFGGGWTVVHRDGRAPGRAGPLGLGLAREYATLLGELDVDWTTPGDDLPRLHPEAGDQVTEIRDRVTEAALDGRPVRLRRSSWRAVAPPHMVVNPADPAHPLGIYVFETWSEAADALIRSCRTTAVVARATDQWWDLECAATDCLALLVETTMRWTPDRSELVELAGGCRWRRIDHARWLCDRCSHLFAPADCL